MKPFHVLILVAALDVSGLLASCKTASSPGGGAPPDVANVVGIAAGCTKDVAAPVLQGLLAKVATDLSAVDFQDAEMHLRQEVAALVSGGLGLEAAWQAVACVVGQVTRDSTAGMRSLDDLAALQAENGKRWIDAHQVVFIDGGPATGAGTAPTGARHTDCGSQ
jgi:tetrahydromethanopterin S-methyltransferase subunit D